MDNLLRFDTISQYNAFNNNETLHPLVSVIDMSKADPRAYSRQSYGFYNVILKDIKCGDLRYGCNYYDYEEGTLVFFAPGQVVSVESHEKIYQPKGYALAFHTDLIYGTALSRHERVYIFLLRRT